MFSTMVGFAVFEGHYDASNISSAGNPLRLAQPVYPPCGVFLPPAFVIFPPNSNQTWDHFGPDLQSPTYRMPAVVNASTGVNCGVGDGLIGYWDESPGMTCDSATTGSPQFHYFSRGEYTLAVEGAWGQQAFAYFVVV